MGKPSKTGAKANAAAAKAGKARAPAPKRVDRSMRKLLAKNERKRKNREARLAQAAARTPVPLTGDSYRIGPPYLIEPKSAASTKTQEVA